MSKGYLYSITTVFLMMTAILLMGSFVARQNDANANLFSLLLGSKVLYVWDDINNDLSDATQLHITQSGNIATFNDTLPAVGLQNFLNNYGTFLNTYYLTPDLEARFLSPSDTVLSLSQLNATIRIQPMNISYYYPDFGKNELFIDANSSNFNAINSLNITLILKNVFFNCDTSGTNQPNRCDKWSPDNSVASCTGITSCVRANITAIDANGTVFNYAQHFFDITGPKKSANNLNVINGTSSYSIEIDFGPMNNNRIVGIDLHNVIVNTLIGFNLNTQSFFVQYLSKLMVNSSAFNTYKVDWIS